MERHFRQTSDQEGEKDTNWRGKTIAERNFSPPRHGAGMIQMGRFALFCALMKVARPDLSKVVLFCEAREASPREIQVGMS